MLPTNPYEPPSAGRRDSDAMRGALIVTGMILPVFWLLLLALSDPWVKRQSGELADYAALLLAGKASLAFWPFVAYSMCCFACAIFSPQAACRYLALRIGVYAGILLAIQYCLTFGIVLLNVKSIASPVGALKILAIPMIGCLTVVVPWVLGWLWQRYVDERGHDLGRWSWLVLVLIFVAALAAPVSLLGVLALSVVSTPFWALAAYALVARTIIRAGGGRLQFNLREVLVGMTWLAAYLTTWRFAVREALEAYAQLPTNPPRDCYVASAAAYGHAGLVASWTVSCPGGIAGRVNLQLKWLKCGEIALRATWPGMHRCVRRIYDRWGPVFAARLRNPWLADAAYLGLKPIEWSVRLVLSILMPEVRQLTQRLYSQ